MLPRPDRKPATRTARLRGHTSTRGRSPRGWGHAAPQGIGAAPPALIFFVSKEGNDVTERKLRAVKPGEKAPAKRAPRKVLPKSVVAAARSGDRRLLLVALRNRIAEAIDDPKAGGPALAALIRQQRDIAAEIQAMDAAARGESAKPSESAIATTPDEAWDESMI